MSGGSSANNSWTILTPEETVAETLRPLAEGPEHHEESLTSATGPGENQLPKSAEGPPLEGHLVSEEKAEELSGDMSTDQHASIPTAITDVPVPTSLEVSASFAPGNDALNQSEGLPEGPAQFSPDPDSFSDSFAHITPSPDESISTPLSTETLGGVEFLQQEEELAQEGPLHSLNGEGLQEEGEDSDLSHGTTDIGKQADSPLDSEVGQDTTIEKTGEEGEPEVRRRRSLLAALERIGRTEEEEDGEEEFQLPQREEDSGFSVNKCILGAVILLGLGTIFLSGVFMDLDEESDYGTREMKDGELPGKQEWLSPEVPPSPVDADSTELLNKLAKGNQQISVLQAQLQAQKEELKLAKGQAADRAKEQLRWEEVEEENTAPVKPTTAPSSGHQEDSTQGTAGTTETQHKKTWGDQSEKKKDIKKIKNDLGERKESEKAEWREGEKRQRKDGGDTEWKKGKHVKLDKEKDEEGTQKSYETKQRKDKDWKNEKVSRGDEGKPWKDREDMKQWIVQSERKGWKEEKDWKKAKHEKGNEGKQWKVKEEKKDWRVGKEHDEKHKVREDWKGEKEWKKGKDGYKESGKEKWEKKDWKEKGEKKEWKKVDRNSKDYSKEGKWKGQRKQWEEGKDHSKEMKVKDERKQWNEREWKNRNGKHDKDWKKKDETKQLNENEWKNKNGKHDKEWKRKDEAKQLKENEWKNKNGKHDKEWKRKDEAKRLNENEWKNKNGKHDKEWKRKDERKHWEKKEEQGKKGGQKEIKDWNKDKSQKHKDEHKYTGNHDHKEEHRWEERKPPHTHRRLSAEQPEYWVHQRGRFQHSPKPPQHCNSLETCAQAEGLLPVPFPEFEAILQTYLTKAEEVGVDATVREELRKLTTEFFKDGVFVHDQMSFQDFAEDLGDVLEDMVEGDDSDDEEDSAIEQEMEAFEKEVMKRFSVTGAGEKEERAKGEWRKESGRGRG